MVIAAASPSTFSSRSEVQVLHCSFTHHVPAAGEPIRSALDALAVVLLAVQRPLEAETIGFFLDDAGRSDTIIIVSGTAEPDSVLAVAECMALAGAGVPSLCGLVVATVRPDADGCLPGDLDRWIDASCITEANGIELIEWFLVDRSGVSCPRELLGEASRW